MVVYTMIITKEALTAVARETLGMPGIRSDEDKVIRGFFGAPIDG